MLHRLINHLRPEEDKRDSSESDDCPERIGTPSPGAENQCLEREARCAGPARCNPADDSQQDEQRREPSPDAAVAGIDSLPSGDCPTAHLKVNPELEKYAEHRRPYHATAILRGDARPYHDFASTNR